MIQLLQGIRVLECAILPAGDQAGRLLGDLGADVVKVERPGIGDYLRDIGGTVGPPRHSPYHLLCNRNKRSISLDLRSDQGRSVFFDLLSETDVFVDGFAGDAAAKLGIGYEDQRKVKSDIVYLQVSGFGARGPYGQIATHGVMMAAAAGAVNLRVDADGFAYEVPPAGDLVHPGQPDPMLTAALFGVMTALAALEQRRSTGQGAYVDAAGSDAVVAAQHMDATREWNLTRTTPPPNPPVAPNVPTRERPKYAYYATKDDKFIMVAAIEAKFWTNLCAGMGRPDLAVLQDLEAAADFRVPAGGEHLAATLRDLFRERTQAEWVDFAIQHDVPIGPAHLRKDLADDRNFLAREVISEEVHPQAGRFTSVGWPAPVEGQAFEVIRGAPLVGEHTDEILTALGYTASRISALRAGGVL